MQHCCSTSISWLSTPKILLVGGFCNGRLDKTLKGDEKLSVFFLRLEVLVNSDFGNFGM